jgi:glycosyltransferase involved in cell wall biosynthesis
VLVTIGALLLYHLSNKPLVSVVMPTYKRAHLLPKAINSILSQSFKNFELIIINDGSPDNTIDVVKSFNDKRIRFYTNDKNRGISYSRNRGFNQAKGKYVMIMDDDDISLPDRMKLQVDYLENNPQIDVVIGQIKDLPIVPNQHDIIASMLIQYNAIGNANIMYRRDFALKYNITYDEKLPLSEDWSYWLDMLFNGAKFHAIDDVILIHDIANVKYHSGNFEEGNVHIRKKVGTFFSPKDSNIFYNASACEKIKMIAPKQILSQRYILDILKENCN